MTHAHTLWFVKTKIFYPSPKSKIQICPSPGNSVSQNFHSDRSTGLDRHSTDMHKACMSVSVDRTRPIPDRTQTLALWKEPVDRESTATLPALTCCSLVLASRPTQSTGKPQRSDFWPLAVDRPGRPAVCQKFWQTQQLYFLTLWL